MPSLALLLVPPLVAAALAIVVKPYRRFVGWAGVVLASLSAAASGTLAIQVVRDGPVFGGVGDIWRVDALSAMLALCIAFVALLASLLGPGLADERDDDPARTRRFRIFMNAFAFTMLAAVTTGNVALMWVAVEATTIMSAIVIPLDRTKASVEASWKYLLICSVGIALAFAGTVLAYFDFVSTAGQVPGALNWSVLRAAAPSLHPELMRLAFAFIVIGYGTKAGLALGPLGTFAALLHLVGHAVAKSMMFLLAGRIRDRYDTTEMARVTGLLRAMPWTGPLFAAGMIALVGLPPFGLFVSEFLLV